MTIQERLKRSNLIMLVVPVAVAGVLLAVGLGVLLLLLETVYLPRLGLTMQDLHALGEQAEVTFADLKSPLTTIRAYTEPCWRASPPTKPPASEYPVRPEPLPLRKTVDTILADCDPEELTLDSTAVGAGTVLADRELLGRILHNLIDNSCKYGATTLTLRSEAAADKVTLYVQDNGPGVPPDQLANLFEPFYRGGCRPHQPGSGQRAGVGRRAALDAADGRQRPGRKRPRRRAVHRAATARGKGVNHAKTNFNCRGRRRHRRH